MASSSSSIHLSEHTPLLNGCLVPGGTIQCPRGIDYCYSAVDGSPIVSDGYSYNKRKRKENRTSPRIVFGQQQPSPLPFNVTIDEASCQYQTSVRSMSGRDVIKASSIRPNPPELKKLTDPNWIWKLRSWFEIKLGDYFIRTPENFFNVEKVRERDSLFNNMFGLPDICRFCVYKNKSRSEESLNELDNVRYWETMQHPLGKKGELMTSDGSFLPVSPWYRQDMEIQYEHLDAIIRFFYSKVVSLDGIMDVDIDPGTETATLYKVATGKSGLFRCGEIIEGTHLVNEFKSFIKNIAPETPNVFKDNTKLLNVPQLFKHGIRVIHEAVYLQRDIRKRKRPVNSSQSQNERTAAQVMVSGMKQVSPLEQSENDQLLACFGSDMLLLAPKMIQTSFKTFSTLEIEEVVNGCSFLNPSMKAELLQEVSQCQTPQGRQFLADKLVSIMNAHFAKSADIGHIEEPIPTMASSV